MPCVSRALVIGGGIGGLAASIALRRVGVAVELVEKSADWRPVGAGLTLAMNAVACLRALGVEVAGHGRQLAAMRIRSDEGRLLQELDMAALSSEMGPAVAIHRGALHEVLHTAAQPLAARTNTFVTALRDGAEGVEVTLSDGTVRRYDLVVAADGLSSTARAQVMGADDPGVIYSGYTCWRTVCADPGVGETVELWGRGLRVGLVPLIDGALYVFLVQNAPRRQPGPSIAAELAPRFASFTGMDGMVSQVFESMADEPLLHHDIDELADVAWGRGRVWLLGDAAHGMTPNYGQGAAMAIEDAAALGTVLAGQSTVEAAHAQYVSLRHSRVRGIQRGARRLGQAAQLESGPLRWLRNLAVRATPDSTGRNMVKAMVAPGVELAKGIP